MNRIERLLTAMDPHSPTAAVIINKHYEKECKAMLYRAKSNVLARIERDQNVGTVFSL